MECLREKFYDGVVLDGRFETLSPLNHGSFGMVFMANDMLTNEPVAIKCLTKKSAITAECDDSSFAIDEKSEELLCHARLGSHPNIVNLIHSFETESHVYIVLEFCARGDLYEAIRAGTGPLETEHVRQFMIQLVDAVSYIHAKGMYHRDIKPENIFLTQSGEMKLGDFGLATFDKWTYETTVGSDRYMSPEQYDSAGAGYAPEQADIWAIGICLLNILFSRNPFTTPTESDPLFLDFSRDKQSLFDVFPSMSQDTYEVVAQCMSLDPRKRSLAGVREALERAITFTNDDKLDEFCAAEAETFVVASANREPLRTPSIQSPQMTAGAFPWSQALQASPQQQIRQLSVIPDDESYSEDLFPSSEESNKDWFSVGEQTPSLASVLNSSLGNSMKNMAIRRTARPPQASLTPISGSLPITMAKPKPIPSMASVFGNKGNDVVSKSWNDMFEEDEEEEVERQIKARQMQNARTWSHESKAEDDTIRPGGPLEPKGLSAVNITKMSPEVDGDVIDDIDGDIVADGFFFHDTPQKKAATQSSLYSPPPKRAQESKDKWAALGERRRAYTGTSDSEKSPDLWKAKRTVASNGLGFTGFGAGLWESKANFFKDTVREVVKIDKYDIGRTKDCPWVMDRRVRDHYTRRSRDAPKQTGDLGDLEWVGGWSDHHV